MLRDESHVEADGEEPEVELAPAFVGHAACDLREPVIDPGENPVDQTADQGEVEVRDDEVRVGQLPVEWGHAEHDARESCYQELEKEATTEKHGCGHT